ncbi:MAG: hypothetical protein M1817_004898 [Caeruleum heppii]|nr:MAG: hypothetical protein M1817_004898 [Caeruleum heppii]
MTDIRETSIVLGNLHCPSCVTNIEDTLATLSPPPVSVSVSVPTRSLVVRHGAALNTQHLLDALEGAGFDIESVGPSGHLEKPDVRDPAASMNEKGRSGLPKTLDTPRLLPLLTTVSRGTKRKRHVERCKMCWAEAMGEGHPPPFFTSTNQTSVPSSDDKDGSRYASEENAPLEMPLTVIDNLSQQKPVRAVVAIAGMTCSSCVRTITQALQDQPRLSHVQVNLLSATATLEADGEQYLQNIPPLLDSLGYEAHVGQVEPIPQHEGNRDGLDVETDVWRATFAIGGMTCSSCISAIKGAVESLEWVVSADVNLLSNSATVILHGREHIDDLRKTVEDIGYDATLAEVRNLQETKTNLQRSVAIRVDGMFCEHCPTRIHDALQQVDRSIRVEKALTLDNPIVELVYTPRAPALTIRNIIACIAAVDAGFRVTVFHPPSIEERSKMMRDREQKGILFRVILSVVVAIPTFIIGIVSMSLLPSKHPIREYFMLPVWSGIDRGEIALFVLATPVYFFAADIFHRHMLKEIRAMWRPGSRTPLLQRFYRFGSMNMLMSLGTSIAYFASIAELGITASTSSHMMMEGGSSSYFDSVVFLTMFLLVGRLLEAYSKSKAGDAVTLLGKLRPSEATLVTADQSGSLTTEARSRRVNVDLVEAGDLVRVTHGDSPPFDGIIREGATQLDESSLTGESRPVRKGIGDEVFSGTINNGGPVLVEVTGVAGTSMLDQIVKAVREGQTRRAPIEQLADVLTSYFVPCVVLVAVTTWLIWLSLGLSGALPADFLDVKSGGWPLWSLQFAIAVFVIACPCGIGLAAPTALFVGGGLAAHHGILVKGGGEAFQLASDLDCIVFDKTGTLTVGGQPKVTDHKFVDLVDGWGEEEVLAMVRAIEEGSSHPLAKAAVAFCEERGAKPADIEEVEEIAGKGMRGIVTREGGRDLEVLIGNEALMNDYEGQLPLDTPSTLEAWKGQGKSVVLVATRIVGTSSSSASTEHHSESQPSSWQLLLILAISDPLRPEAARIIRALQRRGLSTWMISGDNRVTAHAVGAMAGIPTENIIAGVLPSAKADKIRWLQRTLHKRRRTRTMFGRRRDEPALGRATIAMVGDGINDSPALTAADIGIAIGSGSSIAISSASFVLIRDDLATLLTLLDLSRKVFGRIKLNFGWALVYNLVAVPVAAGALYGITTPGGTRVRLDPVWASLAMALSSLSVVGSSLALRGRWRGVGFRATEGRS